MTLQFQEWPKIPRYSKAHMTITEKIDGTNAQLLIVDKRVPQDVTLLNQPAFSYENEDFGILAGSRSRYITPTSDNFGFARWVSENGEELLKLGPGRHYGEWWGPGIQRGYGLKEKRFSLFNVWRWGEVYRTTPEFFPACAYVVPVLYQGRVDHDKVEGIMMSLNNDGSVASPGFMRPEGIIIQIGQQTYKHTFDNPEGKWKEAA